MIRNSRLLLVALMLSSNVALADGGPPGDVLFTLPAPPPHGFGIQFFADGPGPGPMLPLFLHRADLTPEQRAKIHEVLESNRAELQKLLTRLEQANDAMSAKLFAARALKLADVEKEVAEVSELRRRLMVQGLETTLEIRAIMTPEQLAKVAAVKTRMDKLHAEMRGLLEGKE